MSESLQLKDPLYKLFVRFGNGEVAHHITDEPLDPRALTPETRFAVITAVSVENPSEVTDITVLNLKDVTYVRTERVTREQLTAEPRMAGIRAVGPALAGGDDRLPKTIARLKFI